MTKLWIIKNAHTILTMDDTRRELNGHDILLRDGVIAEIGENLSVPVGAEIVDAQNAVVTPGLVNTHHHLYQSLTRAVPGGQDALLFGWLQTLIRFGRALVQKKCAFPRCWG